MFPAFTSLTNLPSGLSYANFPRTQFTNPQEEHTCQEMTDLPLCLIWLLLVISFIFLLFDWLHYLCTWPTQQICPSTNLIRNWLTTLRLNLTYALVSRLQWSCRICPTNYLSHSWVWIKFCSAIGFCLTTLDYTHRHQNFQDYTLQGRQSED